MSVHEPPPVVDLRSGELAWSGGANQNWNPRRRNRPSAESAGEVTPQVEEEGAMLHISSNREAGSWNSCCIADATPRSEMYR